MKLIDPIIYVEDYDGKAMMKRIERACRTCYRSENSINEESYKKLLANCLNRGHESILEHEKVSIRKQSKLAHFCFSCNLYFSQMLHGALLYASWYIVCFVMESTALFLVVLSA